MNIKTRLVRPVLILTVLIMGITSGALVFSSADTYLNQGQVPSPEFPINQYGETYGSALKATSPDNEPDLIKAYGIDGTLGYVKSSDLKGVQPKTPQEALDLQAKTPSSRKIPLYESDGKTVIGEFQINKGEGVEIKAEGK